MKHLWHFAGLTALMLVIFTSLSIVVNLIPHSLIAKNVERSVQTMHSEGEYPEMGGLLIWNLDNYTDCLMMSIAWQADSEEPVESAMQPTYSFDEQSMTGNNYALICKHDAQAYTPVPYGRYWHGYQVLLRPLLMITDISGVRVLNIVLLTLLLVMVTMSLCRQVSKTVGLLAGCGMLATMAPAVPLSMQFCACYYLALIGMLLVLRYPRLHSDLNAGMTFMFVMGSCASFFDLLTAPVITLGLPLLTMMLLHREAGKPAMRTLLLLCLAWAAGYGLLWFLKWVMVWVLTGEDIFAATMAQAKLRMVGGGSQDVEGLGAYAKRIAVVAGFFIVLAAGLAIAVVCQRDKKAAKAHGWLLVIAALVPVWWALLLEQSMQHIFFTWRGLTVTIVAVLVYCALVFSKESKKGA